MLNLLLGLLISAVPLPAKPLHYVTDNAAVLPADRLAALEGKLQNFERETSNQVIVYIDRKVPEGTTLEEMSAQAIREWGVGQKGKDNGVILFLFTEERKMRIEVGYGLEGSLTDAKSKLITSSIMKPRLREGDYPGAVEHGIEAIFNTVRGEKNEGSGRTVAEANVRPGSAISFFIFMAVFGLFGLIVVLAIWKAIRGTLSGSDWSKSFSSSSSNSSWSSSSSSSSSDSSWSSSDSSSSSDSGFSGGGGDGGGGGASDSW